MSLNESGNDLIYYNYVSDCSCENRYSFVSDCNYAKDYSFDYKSYNSVTMENESDLTENESDLIENESDLNDGNSTVCAQDSYDEEEAS